MDQLQFAKVFIENFLWSLFAKLFYRQCILLYSILMSRFANQHKSTLQKKQAHRLVSLLISVTIVLITTSVYTHASHYPLFESATNFFCEQSHYAEKINT